MPKKKDLTKTKQCIACGTVLPTTMFTHKNKRCITCVEEDTEYIAHPHYRMKSKLEKLQEEVRWKNARILKGFKPNIKPEDIPEPKDISWYLP